MEQESKDLNKEHLKLTKLANEAGEICSNFLNVTSKKIFLIK